MSNVRGNRRILATMVDLATHFVLAIMLAWFFWWLTGGWIWPVLGIIGGVLIDIDHFLDYFLWYGLKFNLKNFLGHRYLASGRCYIILHSWEIIALLWVLSAKVLWITPIATGMTIHIVTDYFFSHYPSFMSLSLLYRWYNGFRLDKVSLSAP